MVKKHWKPSLRYLSANLGNHLFADFLEIQSNSLNLNLSVRENVSIKNRASRVVPLRMWKSIDFLHFKLQLQFWSDHRKDCIYSSVFSGFEQRP